jgi:hypothetical protein
MTYEVQHYTLCDGWINCWTITDENDVETLETFDTIEEAQAALDEFFADLASESNDSYSRDDYRIVAFPAPQPPQAVHSETAYGATQTLSFSINVF